MNILRYADPDFGHRLGQLTNASPLFDRTIEDRARAILDQVRQRGDAALLELTERFDGARLRPDQLIVTTAELLAASLKANPQLRKAIDVASGNIERFSRKALRKAWSTTNSQGGKVGEKFDPFGRVGVYIPGGTAPLVSTALMTVTLARVAGCLQIVACTPCDRKGAVNPALLFALRHAGATEIYRVGGAQAIAAMAYGTTTIRRVQKIFGPGNAYVVAAKRLLFGQVAIDLLPGPSEVLIIADETADARFAAADLLAQAEHGSGQERVWLLTTSSRLLEAVNKEIERQLGQLSRCDFISAALKNNGWLLLLRSMDDAIAITNQLAPEHCEIMTRQPSKVAERIVTAGAIFLGAYSPTVLGDYVAGPSHVLPTGGAGVSFAGLTVDQFQRRTSLTEYNRAALSKTLDAVSVFAKAEGLDAHGHSARIRIEKRNSNPRKRK